MKCGVTPNNIIQLRDNEVFVFGSNQAGSHGAGAALTAMQWGAIAGFGEGLYGQTYALPTKDARIRTRHLADIYESLINLFMCISHTPEKHFLITKVGCGLAGLSEKEVAPMFRTFMELGNCSLPQEFIDIINQQENKNG